jgi:hypothetical protein
MSQQLISRSPDLTRLRDDGYDVEVRSGHLLVKDVPYVNSAKEVRLGTLVSELTLAGDVTSTPSTHVAHFVGEHPCLKDGSQIAQIKNQSREQKLAEGVVIQHSFSSKPLSGAYKDYYEKMTTYAAIISSQAQSLDRKATPMPFPVVEPAEDESVFNYLDTASSRAGIGAVAKKLEVEKLAIVGLGGTGSYVLDLVAKTPVKEIHLFDGDKLLNHNAFRSPGAASIDQLRARPLKVAYLQDQYSKMHRRIVAHGCYLDGSNSDELKGMDFVFLCLDKGSQKQAIIEHLEAWGAAFIDVGMGVQLVDDALLGVVRVTTSTPAKRDHVRGKKRIPFTDGDGHNEYSQNIQIADLNALNAALAVIKWKKLCGFYRDLEGEHFSAYEIDGNHLLNEDHACNA